VRSSEKQINRKDIQTDPTNDGASSKTITAASKLLREEAFDATLRELQTVARRALRRVESLRIPSLPSAGTGLELIEVVQRFEIGLITSALVKTGGNQLRAAKLLGVKRSTLYAKILRYKIDCSP